MTTYTGRPWRLTVPLLAVATWQCTPAPAPTASLAVVATRDAPPLAACVAARRAVPIDSLGPVTVAEAGDFLRISRTVPGGLTSLEVAADSTWVLQLADTTASAAVRAALLSALSQGATAPPREVVHAKLAAAQLRQVAWSLAELHDWSRYLLRRLMPAAGTAQVALIGGGVSTVRARVVIDVEGAAARQWVEQQLATARIPCGLVEFDDRTADAMP